MVVDPMTSPVVLGSPLVPVDSAREVLPSSIPVEELEELEVVFSPIEELAEVVGTPPEVLEGLPVPSPEPPSSALCGLRRNKGFGVEQLQRERAKSVCFMGLCGESYGSNTFRMARLGHGHSLHLPTPSAIGVDFGNHQRRTVDMPLVVVSGAEPLLRRRAVLSVFGSSAVQIVHTVEALERALTPEMFGEALPIWCRDLVPTEPMLTAVEAQEGLVVWELDAEPTAKSPILKRKDRVQQWIALPSPKPWEKRAAAVDFVRGEAMRLHLILPEVMASSLVALVGTDLGVLSFELDKLACLAKRLGQYEVTAKIINQTLGGFVETGMDELIHAVGQRHPAQILGSLTLIERTHGVSSSTVLKICGALVYHARIWLCCKTLCSGDPGPLSERLGIHAFVLRKQHFPHAVQWTERDLLTLIAGIAGVGRAVRQGCVSPFLQLQGVLVGLAKVTPTI